MSRAGAFDFWSTAGVAFDLSGAIALASLALWLWPKRARFEEAGGSVVAALILTAAWCVTAAAAATAQAPMLASLAESIRNLAWLVSRPWKRPRARTRHVTASHAAATGRPTGRSTKS